MAASTYFNTVEKLYIAFYQRPADPAGLLYWSNLIDVANGNATAVINAFATSAEATALYGPINSTTIGTVIDAIYTALYNRPADTAGKAFYVNGFTAGTFTAGSIAVNILNGATGTDAVAINNKVAVATTFTQQVDGRALTDVAFGTGTTFAVTYDGNDLTAARSILKTVDANPANTLNASQITTALQTQIANTGDTILGTVSGTTFTLTTGLDTLTGTNNNDTFNGDNATTSASDTINGGAGTDTFNYTDGSTTGATLPAATFTSIEVFNVRNVNSGTGTAEAFTATVTGSAVSADTVTFDGTTITLANGDNAATAAGKIAAGTYTNWTATATGAVVTFTAKTAGQKADTAASAFTVVDTGADGAQTIAVATTVQGTNGATDAVVASNYAGATNFNAVTSTGTVNFSALASGQQVGIVGNGSTTVGDVGIGYAASATTGVINISGGTTIGSNGNGVITETGAGITSNTINSTGAANTVGAIVLSGTANTALTINAATNLTTGNITGFTGTTSKITATGAAAAVSIGTLENTIGTVDASGMTAGGLTFTANTNAALAFVGGAGNDLVTVGATALTTGSIAAGAGTGDRLTVSGSNAAVATSALGAKFSGFEVLGLTGGVTVDMDNLSANNTFTSLRLGSGTNIANNVNTTAGSSVTVTASGTDTINIKGATTPGQVDTMALTVSDGLAAVNTITLTAPSIAGVENVNLTATDNVTITSLTNAAALINTTITGAGNVSITTSAMALQTNFSVNASTATGNLTFDATGETTNGFSLVGSSGTNTITGGNQIFSANISASAAKADLINVTNATGGTLVLPNATITGFTNSANVSVGDKLDIDTANTVNLKAAVPAAASTTDATVTAALSATGILTFGGTGAAGASLATKIQIALEAAYIGGTNYQVAAFEHNGNTYIVESNGAAGYAAGADIVVQLTGVTGVTALSQTASGANTVYVV